MKNEKENTKSEPRNYFPLVCILFGIFMVAITNPIPTFPFLFIIAIILALIAI